MFCACTNTREKQTVRMQETKNKSNDLILNGPTNIKYTYTRPMEDFHFFFSFQIHRMQRVRATDNLIDN